MTDRELLELAAYFFEWARILMAVIFLVSFLHFAWTQLKG